jgi:hypothetical protein
MSQAKLDQETQLHGCVPLARIWFIRAEQMCGMNSGLVSAARTLGLEEGASLCSAAVPFVHWL